MILGLVGRRRVGKDTCAEYFISRGFVRVALADAPKLQVSRACGLPESLTWWEKHKDEPYEADPSRTHRDLVIQYANKARERDPDVWVSLALEECLRHEAEGRSVVVTDIRFPNEASAFYGANAVLLKIVRSGIDTFDDPADSGTDAIPDWMFDGIIDNNGPIEALWAEARDAARALPKDVL